MYVAVWILFPLLGLWLAFVVVGLLAPTVFNIPHPRDFGKPRYVIRTKILIAVASSVCVATGAFLGWMLGEYDQVDNRVTCVCLCMLLTTVSGFFLLFVLARANNPDFCLLCGNCVSDN